MPKVTLKIAVFQKRHFRQFGPDRANLDLNLSTFQLLKRAKADLYLPL